MATCKLLFDRPASYWHLLPEYEQARKALWTSVNPHTGKRRIDEAFPEELRESKDEQQMYLKFKNGSTWQLVASDRYDALVGASVAGVVFSEWALANPSAWGFIRPMIEENDGWAAFISTPRGRNHCYDMYKMAVRNPDRWFAELSPITATHALDQQQLDDALSEYIALYGADVGRAQYEQEYLCSFNAAVLGAFFALEMAQVRTDGRIVPVEADPDRPVNRAWDLGMADDTAIWFWQTTPAGQVLLLDHYCSSGVALEHYRDKIKEKHEEHGWKHGTDYVPHDATVHELNTGRTRVETMQQLGLAPMLVARTKKQDQINAARRTLPLCVFHPRCEDSGGIPALEMYRREWDDERKCFKANEVHDWTSDTADAFMYMSLAWRPLVQAKPEFKPSGWYVPPPEDIVRGRMRL